MAKLVITRISDQEADTVAGKTGKACLVTLTDRYSRFLKIQKVVVKKSKLVKVEVYFPDPHAPCQRGTNENTNGLLREYFPKGSELTLVDEHTIQLWEDKLNNRPRKCLNWKTPYEVFYGKIVHLI